MKHLFNAEHGMATKIMPMLVVLCCCLSACSGNEAQLSLQAANPQTATDADDIAPAGLDGILPPLPDERAVSADDDEEQDGIDFWMKSDNAKASGNALRLTAGASRSSWAIWRVNASGKRLRDLTIELAQAPQSPIYIALANYDTGRWSFTEHDSAEIRMNLDDAVHRSPQGHSCYAAVLATSGSDEFVGSIGFGLDALGWNIVDIAGVDDNALYQTGFEMINGHPAILYDGVEGLVEDRRLTYVRCSTITGTHENFWTNKVEIFDDNQYRYYAALLEVEGRPAIAVDRYSTGLSYIRSTSPDGGNAADWQQYHQISGTYLSGSLVDMEIINGNPAMSFNHSANVDDEDLMYVRSSSSTGEGNGDWDDVVTLANDTYRIHSSLAEISGKPAIAYRRFGTQEFVYTRSSSDDGSLLTDWDSKLISSGINEGSYVSLLSVDGKPAMSHFNWTDGRVYYMRSASSSGMLSGDWQSQIAIADLSIQDIAMLEMELIDGRPALGYANIANGNETCFNHSSTATGSNLADWNNQHSFGDSSYAQGALLDVNGSPAMLFFSFDEEKLKYAIFID